MNAQQFKIQTHNILVIFCCHCVPILQSSCFFQTISSERKYCFLQCSEVYMVHEGTFSSVCVVWEGMKCSSNTKHDVCRGVWEQKAKVLDMQHMYCVLQNYVEEMLLLWRWRVHMCRISKAACSLCVGEKHWQFGQNPAWNKRRIALGCSGECW